MRLARSGSRKLVGGAVDGEELGSVATRAVYNVEAYIVGWHSDLLGNMEWGKSWKSFEGEDRWIRYLYIYQFMHYFLISWFIPDPAAVGAQHYVDSAARL